MKPYLKEWTDKDFTKVNKAIEKYFGGKKLMNHRGEYVYFPGNIYEIEKILGLPYTSTSMCPMMAMDCNVIIYVPQKINIPIPKEFHYSHVILDENKNVVLVAWDDEENEMYITI